MSFTRMLIALSVAGLAFSAMTSVAFAGPDTLTLTDPEWLASSPPMPGTIFSDEQLSGVVKRNSTDRHVSLSETSPIIPEPSAAKAGLVGVAFIAAYAIRTSWRGVGRCF